MTGSDFFHERIGCSSRYLSGRCGRGHAAGRHPRLATCGSQSSHSSVMKRGLQFAVALFVCTAVAVACNIPVFRFALERWKPDSCEVIVFHDQPLTTDDEAVIAELETASLAKGGVSNLNIIRCDLRTSEDQELDSLWLTTKEKASAQLPFVVARSLKGQNKTINHWHGTLPQVKSSGMLASPARMELTKRLQNSDAIVWLVLKSSSDDAQNKTVVELLRKQCKELPNRVELPEGIGLPGSELFSEMPLLIQFSVLEIDRSDPKEQYLVQQLSGFQSQAVAADEPLVVPIFGRGRALEVIPASQLNEDLVFELTEFLCGACSCQVKEQNPGFDLLLSTNWNVALFGEDAEGPPPGAAAGNGQKKTAELVPIPSGRKKQSLPK